MGTASGEIGSVNYRYISIDAHCAACEPADHFAELFIPHFDIKVVTVK